MANNNLEAYLEAILAAVEGGEIPEVPVPSWNIEKYLAAILGSEIAKKPLVYYATTSSGGPCSRDHGLTEGTDGTDWQKITNAVNHGVPVLIMIGDMSYPVVSLFSGASIATGYAFDHYVVITGQGSSGTSSQKRLVWRQPSSSGSDVS